MDKSLCQRASTTIVGSMKRLGQATKFTRPFLRLSSAPQHPALHSYPLIITRIHRPPPTSSKSLQRLAFEEDESIKQARHEADMARKAAAQELELEHEVRSLEVRRQYAVGLLSSSGTPASVLYPANDPNGPLEKPDTVSSGELLPFHAADAVGNQRGGDESGDVKKEREG